MRLDAELVSRGLARSRTAAQSAIAAGVVTVNGAAASKPSQAVGEQDAIVVTKTDHYVSRAAHKLLGALEASGTKVPRRVLDAGASTGGFTQVCLEAGAERVYAVDVGHGQLDQRLRDDPRVTVWERTNLRSLNLDHVGGVPVGLVVADVSFISLRLLLRPLLSVLESSGEALVLVKPQFEVGRSGLDAHGVVRDERRRHQAVAAVCETAGTLGWQPSWTGASQLPGENGNVEFFVKLVQAHDAAGAARAG